MVTFEDARRIVAESVGESWPTDAGTFVVLDRGGEDATHWHVIAGAREYLVDGDAAFCRMDPPAYLVDKHTGAVTYANVIENFDRLGAMRHFGG